MENDLKEQFKNKINLIIIAFVSLLAISIIPFLTEAFNGSSDEEIIQTVFPSSTIGWVVWAIFRFMIIAINMSIFIAFVNQAKINVKDDIDFKKATGRWLEIQVYRGKRLKKHKKPLYLTPKEYFAKLYGTKGLSLAISSFASCFTITMLVLNWDLATFIVICLTVLFAIVFGFLTMQKVEFYWTHDFVIRTNVEYDKMLDEQKEGKENDDR